MTVMYHTYLVLTGSNWCIPGKVYIQMDTVYSSHLPNTYQVSTQLVLNMYPTHIR